jgi:YgiT-type zinc finger domain-containing protein
MTEETMDGPGIDWIRERVAKSYYHLSEHCLRFLMAGKVSIEDIEEAVSNGSVFEIHKNPQRGTTSVVLGYAGNKPVHVKCADGKNDRLVILFAYSPSLPIWQDPETRAPIGDNRVGDSVYRRCFFCNGEIKDIVMGNFDYRLEGNLYVIKKVPAGLCQQCGEKYITAETGKRINEKIRMGQYLRTEETQVLEYE